MFDTGGLELWLGLLLPFPFRLWYRERSSSIGIGNMMVEFFSAEMLVNVCKYLSCSATGLWLITSAASFNATDARCSPSAATTLARASRVASASVAMALCICTGRRTSFLLIQTPKSVDIYCILINLNKLLFDFRGMWV